MNSNFLKIEFFLQFLKYFDSADKVDLDYICTKRFFVWNLPKSLMAEALPKTSFWVLGVGSLAVEEGKGE